MNDSEARKAAWDVYKPRRGFDAHHPARVVNEGHKTLNAAIDAYVEALWRPIESAPKVDGARYLVGQFGVEESNDDTWDASRYNGTVASVRWSHNRWLAEGTEERLQYCEPTHWMPLPPTPESSHD